MQRDIKYPEQINVRMTKALARRFKAAAKRKNMNPSEACRQALILWCEQ